MFGLLGLLKRQGLLRGVFGGSQAWLALWLALVVRDRLKRSEAEVVFRQKLEPGESLRIAHLLEDHRGRVPRRLRERAHSEG